LDNCGTCDNDPSNDCDMDCSGDWGGSLENDDCGVCGGPGLGAGSYYMDCWDGIEYCSNSDCPIDPSAVSYKIYRNGLGIAIAEVQGETGYTDLDLGYNEQYCYTVTYVNDGVESHHSNQACAITDAMPIVEGCMSSYACNYDENATVDDGSCWFVNTGCGCEAGQAAVADNCGVCDTDSTNDCVPDCNGDWGGTAELDNCGMCGGDDSCLDCAGTPNGNAVLDNCGMCGGDNSCLDCAGIPNGNAVLDNCGICDDNGSNDCTQDCYGVWGGDAVEDECGVCSGDNSCLDCAGTPNGNGVLDNCGTCDDDPSNNCIPDCSGEWGGNSEYDNCGTCDNNSENDCIKDCDDVWGGTGEMDLFGACCTATAESPCIITGCDLPDSTVYLTETSMAFNSSKAIKQIKIIMEGSGIYGSPLLGDAGDAGFNWIVDPDSNWVLGKNQSAGTTIPAGSCGILFNITYMNIPVSFSSEIKDADDNIIGFSSFFNSGCFEEIACNYNPYTIDYISGSCNYPEEEYLDCSGECLNDFDEDGVCDELSLYDSLIPTTYTVNDIYPNPFNPIANIIYGIPENAHIRILVFDIRGRQVAKLIDSFQFAGYHAITWDASPQPSGVYLVKILSGRFNSTQKVVLMK